jgi:hypothetical protein
MWVEASETARNKGGFSRGPFTYAAGNSASTISGSVHRMMD